MRIVFIAALGVILAPLLFGLPVARAGEEGSAPPPVADRLFPVDIGRDAPSVNLVVGPDKIAVYVRGSSRELLQEIPCDPVVWPEPADNERVTVVDMNFDGYADLKVLSARGGANTYYDCWLWDQAGRRFIRHEKLSWIASPRADAAAKVISSFNHISATDSFETSYRFEGGRLRPVSVTEKTCDQGGNFIHIEKYEVDANGCHRLTQKMKISPSAPAGLVDGTDAAPFPNATLYRSPQGFSLLLPEGAIAKETGDGTEIRAPKWLVIVNSRDKAVASLDDPAVRAGLEEQAVGQSPLTRCEVEWAGEADTATLNDYVFYRRSFSGSVDGAAIFNGTFYYGNVNGRHLRLASIEFPGISDGVILMVKMLYTLAVE